MKPEEGKRLEMIYTLFKKHRIRRWRAGKYCLSLGEFLRALKEYDLLKGGI